MNYPKRIKQLQQEIGKMELAAAVLFYSRDILYYTGTGQPGILVIPSEGEPVFLTRRTVDWVNSHAPWLTIIEETGIRGVTQFLYEQGIKNCKIGVEEDVIPATTFNRLQKELADCQLIDISPIILEQRMVKDEGEIGLLRKAAQFFDEVHKVILEQARPGVKELDLAAYISCETRKAGNEPVTFFRNWGMKPMPDGNIASGDNTHRISGLAMSITGVGISHSLPWGASNRRLEKGDLICVDISLTHQGYHSDLTRTYVLGQANDQQRKLYSATKQVFNRVVDNITIGVRGDQLYQVAAKEAEMLGLQQFFQGYGRDQGKYIGHGLGLEGDEWPGLNVASKQKLVPNTVFTIEPKFIVPGVGGAQVEEMILLKSDSLEFFSEVPLNLFELNE